jgi:hypothetical protein
VIHIRNIPNEVSEAEIIHLGIPFGRVTNVLVLKVWLGLAWPVFLIFFIAVGSVADPCHFGVDPD